MPTTRQRNRLLNIVMVALVAIIVAAGVLFVLDMRGMLPSDANVTVFTTTDKTGNVNIQREGVSYQLDEQAPLRADDQVETLSGSSITARSDDKGSAAFDEQTKTTVHDAGLQLDSGGLFGVVPSGQTMALQTTQASFSVGAATVVVTAQTGTTQIFVLDGSVDVNGTTVSRGEGATIADGSGAPTVQKKFAASTLDDFMLARISAADKAGANLCLSRTAVKKELAKRAKERKAASSASGSVETDKAKQKGAGSADSGNGPSAGGQSGSASDAAGASAKKTTGRNDQAATPSGNAANDDAGASDASSAAAEESSGTKRKAQSAAKSKQSQVTVEIRCDTILKHKKRLAAGKSKYVPSNGVILARTKVKVADGDTAFDVLKAACDANRIQLEYRYTPVYDTNYIEGINNLYEKDCGDQSGWIYKVNGWEPNVGCSQYPVKNGDAIVWAYTCEGYGKDVA